MTDISNSHSVKSELEIIEEWLGGGNRTQQEILDLIQSISVSEYESIRTRAAEKLDWRVSVLDIHRNARDAATETNNLFTEPEPWRNPVSGPGLLTEIKSVFQRHVVFSDEAATACSLWVLHTYAFDATYVSPILAITSPEKRCGKTTLLGILDALSYRPLACGSITPASIFRIIEQHRPTLLIDEADTFLSDNELLRGVINSGHTKSTAKVIRCVGENHEPRPFSTWAPKAIACIGGLSDTIRDRSIEIKMQRKKNTDKVERFRERDHQQMIIYCRKMLRWSRDHVEALKQKVPISVDCLSDRAADSWEPLFAIAEKIGERWSEEARKAAQVLSCTETLPSLQTELLADIRNIFATLEHIDKIQSQELVKQLIDLEESPWNTYSYGRPLTPRTMAMILKSYDISSRDIRFPEGTKKGYYIKDFNEAFTRYLPGGTETSATRLNNKDLKGNHNATNPDSVADSNSDKTLDNYNVAHVADKLYGITMDTKDPG